MKEENLSHMADAKQLFKIDASACVLIPPVYMFRIFNTPLRNY